jgi:hypothetical protein
MNFKSMSAKGGSAFGGKIFTKSVILAVFLGSVAFVSPVLAYYPSLSASSQGNGSVLLSVSNANPNSQVDLSSKQTSSLWTVVSNIGRTDNSGYFSQVVSLPTDGSSNIIQLYVTVGGQQSSTTSVSPNGGSNCYNNNNYNNNNCGGCTYNCGSSGSITFSPSSATLSVGQNLNVSIYGQSSGYSYGNYYVSSNSSSGVVTASISGQTLSLYGNTNGSSSISICQSNSSSSCGTLYVTVSGSSGCTYNCGNNGSITFSPSSAILSVGQSLNVSIYGSNGGYSYGNYYISSNSNSGIASASISGSNLNLYGSTSGSSNIIVCQTNSSSSCGTLYVTVSGSGCSYNCGSGSLTFSQSSVNVNVGQTTSVTANNGSGSLYVSTNSNSSVATVSVSGNQINIYGNNSGTANVVICSYSTNCGTLYITVGGSSGYGNISLSQSNVNLTYPQTSTVTISSNGGYSGSYYVSSNNNQNVASATVSGSLLYLSSLTSGSTTVTVCQSNNSSQCASLYVNVNGSGSCTYNCGSGTLNFSPSSESLYVGQSATVSIYGSSSSYSGSYAISSNYNPNVVYAYISGSNLYLTANATGSSSIVVCQNNNNNCGTLYVTVGNGGSGSGSFSLSQNSLSVVAGQSSTVNLYGNGSYYISSNSNSYAATANISGSTLNIYGVQNGNTNVIVCQSSNTACLTLYVTVSGGGNNYGGLYLTQSSLNVNVGQTATVSASGNGGYGFYLGTNSNNSVASATIGGNLVSVYGIRSGTTNIQVCQNNAGGCVTLYVTVGGGTSGGGLQYPGGGNVLGANTYPNGQLIGENGTVYIVYRNTKTGFSSGSVFTGLGFKFANVIQVGTSGLNSSGYTVNTSYASHPWGSWVKSGSTVYFVHEQGLIPVPNWDTFLNNGGTANVIVSANSYDLRLPVLSPMYNFDTRLQ